MSLLAKILSSVIIYGVWLYLVLAHGADMKEYITWLQYALGALVGTHVLGPTVKTAVSNAIQSHISAVVSTPKAVPDTSPPKATA